MDEIYILQNCNEWKEHRSANIEAVSTDYNIILSVIYQQIKNGDMLYKFDNVEDSIVAFKKDVQNEVFNDDLLQYGMIKTFDNMRLESPLSLIKHSGVDEVYTALFESEETTLTVDEIIEILDLENTAYYISKVEMESGKHKFEGFVPMVDDLEEFMETDMYKAFMELEHEGEIYINSNQIQIGNNKSAVMPTKEQSIMLFMCYEELEKKMPFEPIYGWSNDAYLAAFSDDEWDEDFER